MRSALVLAALVIVAGGHSARADDPPPPENNVLCVTVDNPASHRPTPEVCLPKPVRPFERPSTRSAPAR